MKVSLRISAIARGNVSPRDCKQPRDESQRKSSKSLVDVTPRPNSEMCSVVCWKSVVMRISASFVETRGNASVARTSSLKNDRVTSIAMSPRDLESEV